MTSKTKPDAFNAVGGLARLHSQTSEKVFTSVLMLPIDDVVSKLQVRKLFVGIEELAQTMEADQHQSPILVAPKNEQGKYVILKGERRWRACKLLDKPVIKAIIDTNNYSSEELILGELVENIQREALTPIEISHALRDLEKGGMSRLMIQLKIGKSASYISMHTAMLENTPECILAILDKQPLTAAQTVAILKNAYALDPEKTEDACIAFAEHGVSRSNAKNFLQTLKPVSVEELVDTDTSFKESNISAPDDNQGTDEKIESTVHTNSTDSVNQKEASDNSFGEAQVPGGEPEALIEEAKAEGVAPAKNLATQALDAVKPTAIPVTLVQIAVSRVIDGSKEFGFLFLDRVTGEDHHAWVSCDGVDELWNLESIKVEGIYED